jgi:hypothetical protein
MIFLTYWFWGFASAFFALYCLIRAPCAASFNRLIEDRP